jgi:hypothetical protein
VADKHLAEAGWKAIVVKQKLKDPGLGKALAAFDALGDTGAPQARADALDAVQALADKLAKDKTIQSSADALEWIKEIQKTVAKARPAIQTLLKSAKKDDSKAPEESETGETEEEETGDLAARLAAGLVKVRSGGGKTTLQFMAVVAKPTYGLLVAKRCTPKDKKELIEATGGTKALVGTCTLENGKVTFVLDTVKPGLAKQLQKSIKLTTNKAIPVRVRDVEGTSVLDDETDVEETGVQDGTAPPPAPPPPPADPAAVRARLAKSIEAIKTATALRNPALADAIRQATLAATEAGAALKKGDAAGASLLLDRLAKLLDVAKTAPGVSPKGGSSDAWPAAKKAWEAASSAVDAQIAALQAKLRAVDDEELEAIAEFGLNALTGNFRVLLLAAIRDMDVATGDKRAAAAQKLGKAATDLKTHVASSAEIAVCDDNPFGVAMSIRGTLSPALDGLVNAAR